MKNATMLYKAPGPHEIHGGHFDYVIVDADEEGAIDAALAGGWFKTTPEAKDAKDAKDAETNNSLPATRAELEQKAGELGIKFNDKMSDKKLGDLITATLEN
jgi:hypothetical protein